MYQFFNVLRDVYLLLYDNGLILVFQILLCAWLGVCLVIQFCNILYVARGRGDKISSKNVKDIIDFDLPSREV